MSIEWEGTRTFGGALDEAGRGGLEEGVFAFLRGLRLNPPGDIKAKKGEAHHGAASARL